MLSNGFKINESDKCVYGKITLKGYVIVCLYVDDMLIIGSNCEARVWHSLAPRVAKHTFSPTSLGSEGMFCAKYGNPSTWCKRALGEPVRFVLATKPIRMGGSVNTYTVGADFVRTRSANPGILTGP